MGSSGSGNFSDYSENKPQKANQGGTSGTDNCSKAFSAKLEEIDRCEYYRLYSKVPDIGTSISIVHNKRIEAVTAKGETIGYLPTSFNYLAICLSNGFKYNGEIMSSKSTPVLSVQIDVAPI